MKVVFKDPVNEAFFKKLDEDWEKTFGSHHALEGLTEQVSDDQKEWVLSKLRRFTK